MSDLVDERGEWAKAVNTLQREMVKRGIKSIRIARNGKGGAVVTTKAMPGRCLSESGALMRVPSTGVL